MNRLFNALKDLNLRNVLDGGAWLTNMMTNLAMKNKATVPALPDRAAWAEEKDDILGRAAWLCSKVIVEPQQLLDAMPAAFGPHYGNEWAIYSCSHLMAALANIARIYPETRDENLQLMECIIPIVLSPEMRRYDTTSWHEDALASLDGDKHHMTYLSILAWVIGTFRLTGGHDGYDHLFHVCCEALYRRMRQTPGLNLQSFPRTPIFIPDMMFTIVALHYHARLFGTEHYAAIVAEWLQRARTEWIHRPTRLLKAMLRGESHRSYVTPVRGSYTGLNCYCLSLIDHDFALEQHDLMKRVMVMTVDEGMARGIVGVREYLNRAPRLAMDPDAGPIAFGLSPSGTAWALGSATYFEDWELRHQLLHTAEVAGCTVKEKEGMLHYRLGEMAIVGEAVALAARTNIAST